MSDDGAGESDNVSYIVNADKQQLYCYTWNPQLEEGQKPKALVFISHGLAEHCHWHDVYAEKLAEQGILVFSHDHVGHGRSEGERVYVDDFQVYIRDVHQHITSVTDQYPDCPVFITGYSMGGLIAVMEGLQAPTLFRGMILLAPALQPGTDLAAPWKMFFGRLLSYVLPRLPVGKLDPAAMSTDPAVVERYIADPLVWHGSCKGRPMLLLLDAMNALQSRHSDISWPLLVLQGDVDPLCVLSGAQTLVDNASSTDKTLKVFKGVFHLVHWEPNGPTCIVDWILQRCS
ncbi:Monoglyceride lipase [Lamellibrachia satsuma]|nr:Monoglyceride lipase [Lamellibrachia satsuma]